MITIRLNQNNSTRAMRGYTLGAVNGPAINMVSQRPMVAGFLFLEGGGYPVNTTYLLALRQLVSVATTKNILNSKKFMTMQLGSQGKLQATPPGMAV